MIYNDGFLKVTAIQTLHTDRSYAFFLEAEGKSVLFTGDLKHPDEDFPLIAKEHKTDFIVCESAHFNATDYLPHLREYKTKLIFVLNLLRGFSIRTVTIDRITMRLCSR